VDEENDMQPSRVFGGPCIGHPRGGVSGTVGWAGGIMGGHANIFVSGGAVL